MSALASCGDAVVFDDDVLSAREGAWATDGLLTFWFEVLTSQMSTSPRALLIHPSTCFLVANLGPEVAGEILGPLGLTGYEVVLVPVNDNPDVDQAHGGSHWSAVVYHRASRRFHVLDSAAGRGVTDASMRAIAAVAPAVGVEDFRERVVMRQIPQQTNSYDCGIYVAAIARLLSDCGIDLSFIMDSDEALMEHLGAAGIANTREELKIALQKHAHTGK
eukprot:TRINITY_DN5216_c0_g1_i2.p1 TRINITY_DN5216_c0_g1~~TRINITY_DN5216_c0_g1_i2.p1  ORF type:complete len:219 (+),score=38.67 TRINITY_DN5216_c0_g1_i2:242-898(+)